MTAKELVDTYIKANGTRAIKGNILNMVLTAMIAETQVITVRFTVGDEDFPQNGDTEYTNEIFKDRDLTVFTSFKTGVMQPGSDYKRQQDGVDNEFGDTIIPILPSTFSEFDEWTIIASNYTGAFATSPKNILRLTTVAGKDVSSADLINRDVASIVLTNGTTLLTGWTKEFASDTLTLGDGPNKFLENKPIIINLL